MSNVKSPRHCSDTAPTLLRHYPDTIPTLRHSDTAGLNFFPHHLAAISSSIVRADALSIRNYAASLAFQLSHGII